MRYNNDDMWTLLINYTCHKSFVNEYCFLYTSCVRHWANYCCELFNDSIILRWSYILQSFNVEFEKLRLSKMWEPAQGHLGRTLSSWGFVPGDTRIKGRGTGGQWGGVGKHRGWLSSAQKFPSSSSGKWGNWSTEELRLRHKQTPNIQYGNCALSLSPSLND